MGKDFFLGKYLIDRGLVMEEDVIDALEIQRRESPAFEKVSLDLEFLTMKQIFQLLTYQADSDLTFAEVALRKKYLTQEQVIRVNNIIIDTRPFLGKILVSANKITKEKLNEVISSFDQATEKYLDLAEALKRIKIFELLDENALESLAYIALTERYATGETVLREGDEADEFFCIVSGSLKITKNTQDTEGGTCYMGSIQAQDVFGESCIFDRGRRTANVITETETVLVKFNRTSFINFLKYYPKSSISILIFIVQRLMGRLERSDRELACEKKRGISQSEIDAVLEEFFN
ncbi:MAG: cyclic nucleotide-binding domain-containing protein [Nitrospirae bacterium]|nr:cyclic nucleotide-binding domain-containing protein [Nitrospirota bacterium]MBF0535651.1 cyclic nucleotide-binding domain-containing protein [Nitrospirota bacterium]MBF0616957.1 cyclic nucleotide-binding domain-containing protein [Nitrospirota bacterium]